MSLHVLYSQIISATNVSSEVTIKVNCFKKIVTCISLVEVVVVVVNVSEGFLEGPYSLVETTTLIVTNLQFSSKRKSNSVNTYTSFYSSLFITFPTKVTARRYTL